jgi:hypothetical protein
MDPILVEAYEAVKAAFDNAGLLGGLSAALTILLRVYRSKLVNRLLPRKARWASLPGWAKMVLPFLLAGAGATTAALAGGVPLLSALLSGLTVGIGAIGLHHGTKAAGAALDNQALKADPFGEMGKMRQALHLLLPVSKARDAAHEESKP